MSLVVYHFSHKCFFCVFALFVMGFIMTIILQSSLASLLLTLSALSVGQISLTMAASITVGACVGTTIIPFISSLSANAAGRRLALTHFLFNLVTAIIVLPLLPLALFAVEYISSAAGITDANSPLKLAFLDRKSVV